MISFHVEVHYDSACGRQTMAIIHTSHPIRRSNAGAPNHSNSDDDGRAGCMNDKGQRRQHDEQDHGRMTGMAEDAVVVKSEQGSPFTPVTPVQPGEGSHRAATATGNAPPLPANCNGPSTNSLHPALSFSETPHSTTAMVSIATDPDSRRPPVDDEPPSEHGDRSRALSMSSDHALPVDALAMSSRHTGPASPPTSSDALPSSSSSSSASFQLPSTTAPPRPLTVVSASYLPTMRPADPSTSSIPDSTHVNPTSAMAPDWFLPLLNCPLCDPPSLLQSPITLRCGHTICMRHLTEARELEQASSFVSSFLNSVASSSKHKLPLPPCPIPTCKSLSSAAANATAEQLPRHPQSRVNYLPPPTVPLPPDANEPPDEVPPLRVDVTVNKILNLVVHSRPWFELTSLPRTRPFSDADEHTDSEDESESGAENGPDPELLRDSDRPSVASVPDTSLPNRASRRPRARSSSSSRRPRKRPRRSHQSQQQRGAGNNEPPLSASARLEKELYAELTCEICFGLMWQPVTTPCQHVRFILSRLAWSFSPRYSALLRGEACVPLHPESGVCVRFFFFSVKVSDRETGHAVPEPLSRSSSFHLGPVSPDLFFSTLTNLYQCSSYSSSFSDLLLQMSASLLGPQ